MHMLLIALSLAAMLGGERPDTAWGKSVDGLQAGIRRVPAPMQNSPGVVAAFEIVLRNIHDCDVIGVSYPATLWYSGKSDKGTVTVGPGTAAGRPNPAIANLNPGDVVVLGRVYLGLPGMKLNAGHLTEVSAGKYRVGCDRVMPSLEIAPTGITLPPGSRYGPELRTGYLDVDLRPTK